MNDTSTVTSVGASTPTQFIPVLFIPPTPSAPNSSTSKPQPHSPSSINTDQDQAPVNISINLPSQELGNAAALQAAYIAGLSEKTSRHLQRKKTLGIQ
jgi:hypothetical protein